MIGDIFNTLLTDMISGGIIRAVSYLGDQRALRENVSAILKGERINHLAKLDIALVNESRRILGSGLGALDEDFASFLNDVSANGWGSTIISVVASGQEAPSSLKELFERTYSTHAVSASHDPGRLFDAIFLLSQHVFFSLFKDPTQAKYISIVTQNISRRVDRVADAINSFIYSTNIHSDQHQSISLRLARNIQLSNKDLTLETNRGRRRF